MIFDTLINGAYWILAPKGAVVPYIVLSRVATSDVYTMNGATGTRSALFQVDCYATDYYTSRSIALAVRQLLESYRGNLPDAETYGSCSRVDRKRFGHAVRRRQQQRVRFQIALLQFRVWYYDTAVAVAPAPDLTTVIEGGRF